MHHIVIQNAREILAEGLSLNKYVKITLRFVNYELQKRLKKQEKLFTINHQVRKTDRESRYKETHDQSVKQPGVEQTSALGEIKQELRWESAEEAGIRANRATTTPSAHIIYPGATQNTQQGNKATWNIPSSNAAGLLGNRAAGDARKLGVWGNKSTREYGATGQICTHGIKNTGIMRF